MLHPYPNNPRKNDGAVDAVAESIKQCGYCSPIVVDEDFMILAGHTRYKAMQKLGWEQCEVCVVPGLSDEQKKKYIILDNKTSEFAEWDIGKLEEELVGLDFNGFDFGFDKFDSSNLVNDNFHYVEQYGIIVLVKDEKEQQAVYERLIDEGYNCRVVCT